MQGKHHESLASLRMCRGRINPCKKKHQQPFVQDLLCKILTGKELGTYSILKQGMNYGTQHLYRKNIRNHQYPLVGGCYVLNPLGKALQTCSITQQGMSYTKSLQGKHFRNLQHPLVGNELYYMYILTKKVPPTSSLPYQKLNSMKYIPKRKCHEFLSSLSTCTCICICR